MNKIWSDLAWDEYLQWQMLDKKMLKKINALIKDIGGDRQAGTAEIPQGVEPQDRP